jgi:uncharacterized membrane protein
VTLLTLALVLFVGTHFVLSHPLRAPLVRIVGEGGFVIVYSLVAFGTLGWAVAEWRRAPVQLLWVAPDWLWWLAALLMLIASVLFIGSMTASNPALMGGRRDGVTGPGGVQRITRHPMMWAFAIWAAVHATLSGDLRTVILAAAIGILALAGAALQEGKKRAQLGQAWLAHERATSFVPFGLQFAGRAPGTTALPGWTALIGGVLLYAAATWAHPALMRAPQLGFWRMVSSLD